jgi:hypothetical protein
MKQENLPKKAKPTIVNFKKFKESGEIIALFPYVPSDVHGRLCMSYMHVGQHGGAALPPAGTVKATPEEYAPLVQELESLGYNLQIINKLPSHHVSCEQRRLALKRMR